MTARSNKQADVWEWRQRAERANANLEASEASNRQLLITLEEDRKAARRLAVRHEKQQAASNTAGHAAVGSDDAAARATELEDLRQELESERRRANAAEAKARRAIAKLGESTFDQLAPGIRT